MNRPDAQPANVAPPRRPSILGAVRDDIAYMLPMGLFLAFIAIGGQWPELYPHMYVARTIVVAILLALLWRHYTPIRWHHWQLGVIVGIVGILQWIPMQLALQAWFPTWFAPADDAFDPTKHFASPTAMWIWIAIRVIGAVIVVPVMEELFWRDFAWRSILAPNDFKLASIGEWGWQPFVIVPLIFATVHGGWWATSIVWAFMIGGLLLYTKSIGACIIAHAVTNLLLAAYVLYRGLATDSPQWWFW